MTMYEALHPRDDIDFISQKRDEDEEENSLALSNA